MMAIYNIIKKEDPQLREKSKPVTKITPNILKLIKNMVETMYDANGVGLAAPQVGVLKKVIVIDVGDGVTALINPELIEASGEETDTEGCLSCPGLLGEVTRFAKVKVKGLNPEGEEVIVEGEGLMARALQHEIDHLDGILFIDKAKNLRKQD
ncbi:MAG: peptide deformylase [Clostridia bacterium]|jgi:peptide deformylase|nr:peptide deformylase [Clostridia bacterium]MDN5322255.1 peptide deformylase [Clostridia bacterium]